MRPVFFFFLLWILLTACGPILPLDNPFEKRPVPNTTGKTEPKAPLQIFVLNIGQGDSTLIVGPTGKTLLIDGGPPGQGRETVLPFLRERGIDSLDWVVATHYDADHIGGISEILRGVDQVFGTKDDLIPLFGLLDRGPSTDKSSSIYFFYLNELGEFRRTIQVGESFTLGGDATAEVIVANGHYQDGRSIHLNPDEENEACIGILVHYGDFQYFTAGDLTGGGSPGGFETKDMETFAGEIVGDIDILHVGHHGSASSTNENFLRLIQPEAAIISVGKDNDYGHPTKTVLNRLEDVGAKVYRTDLLGTIEIKTDGADYEIGAY